MQKNKLDFSIKQHYSKDEILKFLSTELVKSSSPNFFYLIHSNIIFGISTLPFNFTMNKTYLRNMILEDAENFCALDLLFVDDLTIYPELVGIEQDDSDFEKADKIDAYIKSTRKRFSESIQEITTENGNALTITCFIDKVLELMEVIQKN